MRSKYNTRLGSVRKYLDAGETDPEKEGTDRDNERRDNLSHDRSQGVNIKAIQRNLARLGYEVNVDGTWGDETEAAFQSYLEEEGGGRDSWYNPSRLFDAPIIPRNLSMVASDVFHNQTQGEDAEDRYVTDWSGREVSALQDITNNVLNEGRSAIQYGDYGTAEDRYSDVGGNSGILDMVSKAYNPEYNLKTTLGQATIGVAPPWNGRPERRVIMDQYNFNDARGRDITDPQGWEDVLTRTVSTTNPIYGAARGLGAQFGSGPGEGARTFLVLPEENRYGGVKKYLNGGPDKLPPLNTSLASDGTYTENYGETAFLNQMNALPKLNQPIEQSSPHPPQTFLNQDNRTDSERALSNAQMDQTLARKEAIERGVNPNLAFMYPQSLQGDAKAMATYQYDNPMSSPIGLATNALAGAATAPFVGGAATRVNSAMGAAGETINAGLNAGTNAVARTAPAQYLASSAVGRAGMAGANAVQSGLNTIGKPFSAVAESLGNSAAGRATTGALESGTNLFGTSARNVIGAYGKGYGVYNAPSIYDDLAAGNVLGAAASTAKLPIGARGTIPSVIKTLKTANNYVSGLQGAYGMASGNMSAKNALGATKLLPGTTPARIGYNMYNSVLG